jgi:hypothetical protein
VAAFQDILHDAGGSATRPGGGYLQNTRRSLPHSAPRLNAMTAAKAATMANCAVALLAHQEACAWAPGLFTMTTARAA